MRGFFLISILALFGFAAAAAVADAADAAEADRVRYNVNFNLRLQLPANYNFRVFAYANIDGFIHISRPKNPWGWAANGTRAEMRQGKASITNAQGDGTEYILIDPDATNNAKVRYGVPEKFPDLVRVTMNAPSEPTPKLQGALFAVCDYTETLTSGWIVTYEKNSVPEGCIPVEIYPRCETYSYMPPTGMIQPVRCV